MRTTNRPTENSRAPGPAARKMRRAEDKERAILNKETSVTGKDTDAVMKKRISSKDIESEAEKIENEGVENKKGKGYLRDPLVAVKRVD